jgi:hypothetical protein
MNATRANKYPDQTKKRIPGYKMFVRKRAVRGYHRNGKPRKKWIWSGPYFALPGSWEVKPDALLRSISFDECYFNACGRGVNFCRDIETFMKFRGEDDSNISRRFPKRDYGKTWVLWEGYVPRGASFVQPTRYIFVATERAPTNKCRSTSFRLKRRVRKDELWKRSKRS